MKGSNLLTPIVILASFCVCTSAVAEKKSSTADVGSLFEDEDIWGMSAEDFEEKYSRALGFRWVSEAKQSARAMHDGLELAETKVGETLVNFDESGAKQIQVSLWNRGDDGDMGPKKFDELVPEWGERLTALSGGTPERKKPDSSTAVPVEGVMWMKDDIAYLMQFSLSGSGKDRVPEFLRLRVAPFVKKSFMEEQFDKGGPGTAAKADLPENVSEEDGDTVINNIPMVDQGQKGYCVVASASRVFQYYGLQVTQNELAQRAGTETDGGTSTAEMIESLKGLANRFKTRVKIHDEIEYDDFKDLIKDYNRAVRKHDGAKEYQMGKTWGDYSKFDPAALKDARTKNSSGLSKFKREIERTIDLGIPLLWTIHLGLYPENGEPARQSGGGHMRLIIGYNWEEEEIIFSDSWGKGHETKRMDVTDAFSPTKGIYSIQPLK